MADQYMECPLCRGDLVIREDGKRQCQICSRVYELVARPTSGGTSTAEVTGAPVTDQYSQCPYCGGELIMLEDGKRQCRICRKRYVLVPRPVAAGVREAGRPAVSGRAGNSQTQKKKKSPGALIALIAAVLLVAAAGAFLGYRFLWGGDEKITGETESLQDSQSETTVQVPVFSTAEAAEGLDAEEGSLLHLVGIVEAVGEDYLSLNNGINCSFDPDMLSGIAVGDVVGVTGLVTDPSSASFTLKPSDVPYIYYDGVRYYDEYESFRNGILYPDVVYSEDVYTAFQSQGGSVDVLFRSADVVLDTFRVDGEVTQESFDYGAEYYREHQVLVVTGQVESVAEGYFTVGEITCFYYPELLTDEELEAIRALQEGDTVSVCGWVSNPSVDSFRMNYCYITDRPQTAVGDIQLPDDFPLDFGFSSGAGAWSTGLTLNRDGTFSGGYHNSDADAVYYSNFEGRFEIVRQIDEYTYSLRLTELTVDEVPGTERIEDGMRFIVSEPYGLENGTEFMLYLPGTPHEMLTEDFMSWNMQWLFGEETDSLSGYAIRNVATEYGFYSGN